MAYICHAQPDQFQVRTASTNATEPATKNTALQEHFRLPSLWPDCFICYSLFRLPEEPAQAWQSALVAAVQMQQLYHSRARLAVTSWLCICCFRMFLVKLLLPATVAIGSSLLLAGPVSCSTASTSRMGCQGCCTVNIYVLHDARVHATLMYTVHRPDPTKYQLPKYQSRATGPARKEPNKAHGVQNIEKSQHSRRDEGRQSKHNTSSKCHTVSLIACNHKLRRCSSPGGKTNTAQAKVGAQGQRMHQKLLQEQGKTTAVTAILCHHTYDSRLIGPQQVPAQN
ncbi:hypothetical protein COO60DRAFT_926850 [Scenedesmus sp. NREL 46B-D3]|nr:hypothetical protein COO60DRAFT_926850 [Scenedesmus sp. NREL 46B-D3]